LKPRAFELLDDRLHLRVDLEQARRPSLARGRLAGSACGAKRSTFFKNALYAPPAKRGWRS
jgi:hypothetical protein